MPNTINEAMPEEILKPLKEGVLKRKEVIEIIVELITVEMLCLALNYCALRASTMRDGWVLTRSEYNYINSTGNNIVVTPVAGV